MRNLKAEPNEIYDEIGGKITVGSLVRMEGYKPDFILVRVTGLRADPDLKGQTVMEVQPEPVAFPVKPGSVHKGCVRVVDPASDAVLDRALESAPSPTEIDRGAVRERIRFAENGEQLRS